MFFLKPTKESIRLTLKLFILGLLPVFFIIFSTFNMWTNPHPFDEFVLTLCLLFPYLLSQLLGESFSIDNLFLIVLLWSILILIQWYLFSCIVITLKNLLAEKNTLTKKILYFLLAHVFWVFVLLFLISISPLTPSQDVTIPVPLSEQPTEKNPANLMTEITIPENSLVGQSFSYFNFDNESLEISARVSECMNDGGVRITPIKLELDSQEIDSKKVGNFEGTFSLDNLVQYSAGKKYICNLAFYEVNSQRILHSESFFVSVIS